MINDIFATMKVEPRAGWLLIVLVVVTGAAILVFGIGFKKPDTTQAILTTAKKQMEAQFTNQLKEKDVQIKDYKSRLVVSEGKYKTLVKKYTDLQKEKENVKPPRTNAELRDRFIALGYPPLPTK